MNNKDKNIIIGNNNQIDSDVIIHNNVKIGDNNIIKSGTIIYSNTEIGDNNTILEHNMIGSLAVEASQDYNELKYKGLIIGNNNMFHVRNIISSGHNNKTIIGDNNKILSDVYISHDNVIGNNVTFYPRVFSAGIVQYYDHSNVGAGACVHQKLKVGAYSMIGMNSTITKNVLPYFICINNKYSRLNSKKLDSKKLDNNSTNMLKFIENKIINNSNININTINNLSLPEEIKDEFMNIM